MKIGILTYHSSHNFGAFLQAYALCGIISEQTGHTVEIIDFTMSKAAKKNLRGIISGKRHPASILYGIKQFCMFEQATRKYHTLSKEKLVTDDLNTFAAWLSNKYDVVVVGSDEVWKLDGYRGFPSPYWLPAVTGCKKVSCAISSRTEPGFVSDATREKIAALLETFSYIGVRDLPTKELIDPSLRSGQHCCLNCDPTFFYDFNIDPGRGRDLLRHRFKIKGKKKCVALMINDRHLAKRIINEYKNRFDLISLYYYHPGTKGFYVPDPFEWINIIAGADGLITTFFHGTVFSIKADTPFLAVETRHLTEMKYSKIYDLLARNQLTDRFAWLQDDEELMQTKMKKFFDQVNSGSNEKFEAVCTKERALFHSFSDFMMQDFPQ